MSNGTIEMGSYQAGTLRASTTQDSYIQRIMMGGYAGGSYYTGADPSATVLAAIMSDYDKNPTPDFAYYQSAFDRIVAASGGGGGGGTPTSTSDNPYMGKNATVYPWDSAETRAQKEAAIAAKGTGLSATIGGAVGGISSTMIVIGIGALLILGAVLSFASDKGITIAGTGIGKGAA